MVRTIAMPATTNPAGDIFGGWLMAQMDLAAGNDRRAPRARALRHRGGRRHGISPPGRAVGDEVSLYATIEAVGRQLDQDLCRGLAPSARRG